MQEIDARGLSCPQPVLLLEQALKQSPDETEFKVKVDDFAPMENVARYARSHGLTVEELEQDDYYEVFVRKT